MDELQRAVEHRQWEKALSLAHQDGIDSPAPYLAYLAQQHLLTFITGSSPSPPSVPTLDSLYELVAPHNLRWLTTALTRLTRQATTLDLARKAHQLALKANDRHIATLQDLSDALGDEDYGTVDRLCRDTKQVAKACRARRNLLDMGDRITSWEAIWADSGKASLTGDDQPKDHEDGAEEDRWGDDLDLPSDAASSSSVTGDGPLTPPLPLALEEPPTTPARPALSEFITKPLPSLALALAASSSLPELLLLCSLHASSLYPHRVALLDVLPEWLDPSDYEPLLPAVDPKGIEREWEDVQPWRTEPDWSEALPSLSAPSTSTAGERRTAQDLEKWYLSRVSSLAQLGLVAPALALVQHGAAKGVMGLDSLGEELSLLSKLVYDRPFPASSDSGTTVAGEGEDLTLSYFRSLSPADVIRAYTSTCTPSNLATTLRRLVLPYLSVLESRLERSGTPDPALPTRLLYEYLLSLSSSPQQRPRNEGFASLLAIFEASKPTLPQGARIVKNDADLARLALACLYGAPGTPSEEQVVTMGRIFECLPAFPDEALSPPSSPSLASPSTSNPAEETLFSLTSSSSSSSSPPSASTYLTHLRPLPPSSLSTSLDLLDLHLSQLESLLRYSCPVPLSWFLRSYKDEQMQRDLAVRLARTAAGGGGGAWTSGRAAGSTGGTEGSGGEFEGEDEWVGLMIFLGEGTGVAGSGDQGVDGDEEERRKRSEKGMGRAFWKLSREEVLRIFFGGLLGAGRFSLARSLFEPSSTSPPLEPAAVEELVISASRELYDNAEEGNLHKGEMKLAFDCLSAAPQQSPAIRRERSFIEATSRLCSFRLLSPSTNLPLAPIEIRHCPDRLRFVSLLLSTSSSAHQHPEMILELVKKLGYPSGGQAEVRTLAMLAEAAMGEGEFETAGEMCERAVGVVEALRRRRGKKLVLEDMGKGGEHDADREAAAGYAWPACFQLGKNEAWPDFERRKQAVGQALVLCPPERIAALLPVWTELEMQVARDAARQAKEEAEGDAGKKGSGLGDAAVVGATKVANFLAAAASSATTAGGPSPSPAPDSPRRSEGLASHHSGRDLAAEAAEAASRTLRTAAAYLPSFVPSVAGGSSRPSSAQSQNARPATPTSAASTTGSFPSLSPTKPTARAKPLKGKAKLGARRAPATSSCAAAVSQIPSISAQSLSPEPSHRSQPVRPSTPPSRFASAFDSPPSRFASAFDSLSSPPVGSHAPPPPPPSTHPLSSSASATTDPAGSFSGFNLRAGLSNRLTAGVGWLIGADEMMEEQAKEREREVGREGREGRETAVDGGEEKREVGEEGEEDAEVSITLALGTEDGIEEELALMEWQETRVDAQQVLDEVKRLRDSDGFAYMEIDWPDERGNDLRDEPEGTLVVIDTNILISHLALLRELVHLVSSSSSTTPSCTLLIPHIVLQELDGLKNSSRLTDQAGDGRRKAQTSIASLARAATNWLLTVLDPASPGQTVVRGQRKSEVLNGNPEEGRASRDNDSLVLEAALFFLENEAGRRVVLLSNDNNLRLRATFERASALGVDVKDDARQLLAKLCSSDASSPNAGLPLASPPLSRGTTAAVSAPPSSPASRRRSPPSRISLPATTSVSPIPLPSTTAESASMELDPPTPPPLQAYLPPPFLVPVRTRADVFRNLTSLVTHFLALPIFRHVFEQLKKTRRGEQRIWQEELGDWRHWEARDCAEKARRWWNEGNLEDLCRTGLTHAHAQVGPTQPLATPLVQASVPIKAVSPPPASSPTSGRATSSSRWAAPSRMPQIPPMRSPPPPPAPPPLAYSSRPALSLDKRLSALHLSLPSLTTCLSASPDTTVRWSAPRWEVLLEEVEVFLLAVLGGVMKENVGDEVRSVVRAWAQELRGTGVAIDAAL
ncbi:hypothetical protein JCM11641_007529 [Rhodosporidiobolus odoratus]